MGLGHLTATTGIVDARHRRLLGGRGAARRGVAGSVGAGGLRGCRRSAGGCRRHGEDHGEPGADRDGVRRRTRGSLGTSSRAVGFAAGRVGERKGSHRGLKAPSGRCKPWHQGSETACPMLCVGRPNDPHPCCRRPPRWPLRGLRGGMLGDGRDRRARMRPRVVTAVSSRSCSSATVRRAGSAVRTSRRSRRASEMPDWIGNGWPSRCG